MDKLTYLAELAEGLARWVPERERQDILRYYAEYFEEAGPEREGEVIRELGDPWALSCRLAVDGGFVTQEQTDSWTPPKKKKWPWVLAICAVAVVALIGSLVTMLVGFSQMIFRNVAQVNPVATADVIAVEEGTGFYPLPSEGIAFVEGDDIVGAEVIPIEPAGGIWSMEDGNLDAFDEINVDVSIANVTVTAGEDYTLYISSDMTLGGYSLKWEIKNGVLRLRDSGAAGQVTVNSWEDFKNVFGVNATAMDVIITMPAGAVMDVVKIKTGLGDVYLSGLESDKVEAETGLGDVECYELMPFKKLNLKSRLGDVSLGLGELYDGMDIDLETNLGQVEANLGCAEQECEYELDTDLGTVTVNGRSRGTKAEQKGNYPYKLDAESNLGDVNVYFQDDQW